MSAARIILGSARVSRAGFGVSPKQSFEKVRDRDQAIASARDARALSKRNEILR